MLQCERCGASNQPQSRFCVSCGSPIASAQPPQPPPAQAPYSPPQQPQPAPHPQHRGPAPAWNPSAQPPQAAPAVHHQPAPNVHGPPSSGLPFANTASPPSGEEFAHMRAAHAAAEQGVPQAGAAHGSGAYEAPGAHPVPTNPPPQGQYPQATAAMPGVAQDPEAVPDGAPRILCGFIVSYEGNPLGSFWPILQGRNVLGREGAPLELDIRIAHPTTSSRHAVIRASARPGRIKLEDAGSTNGTFVNDARLTPGQPIEVRDGDQIRFGLFPTVVKIV